jgi:aminoglycoside/choline kinase family phosphotransferase
MPWDYQATNMMILGPEPTLNNLGLIDIQDARVAPIAQDLAILLRDIRRTQNDALEAEIIGYVATQLAIPLSTLQNAVEICNFQHAVRIIGGLARSALRDGKWGGAERFMARTWETLKQSKHPALIPLQNIVLPLEAPMLATLHRRNVKAA